MECGEVGPIGALVQNPVGRVTKVAGKAATTRSLLGAVISAKEEATSHSPVTTNFAGEL